MRALVVSGPGEVGLADVDPPAGADGLVLVAPKVVGMCGTDLEIIDGTIDQAYVRLPLVLGHEWSGVVVSGGPTPGTRVVVEGIVPCGQCDECVIGSTNRCRTYDEVGFMRQGAAADLIAVPGHLVHSLTDAVSFESGALVEPSAVVYRGLDRVSPPSGARVLVIGDGTVGLLAAHLVRLWSPAAVHVCGLRAEQRELARLAGADEFVIGTPSAGAYDLVIEAAGAGPAVESAFAAVARGGSVLLLGLAGTGTVARMPVDDIVNGDIAVIGSFAYTRAAWSAVVERLNAGLLDPTFLVTDRFPLSRWEDAIERLRRPDGVRGKVLLDI